MTDQDPTAELKSLTREHMRLIWEHVQLGGKQLNDEDRRTADAMREHPEYAHLWDRLDQLSDAEITKDGSNPILHIMMHVTVENQIANSEPPEARQTVAGLERRGLSHHEAVHRVASVMSEEIWRVLTEKQPSDGTRYVARLAELLRNGTPRLKSPTRSAKRHPKRKH